MASQPVESLLQIANNHGMQVTDAKFAEVLDAQDILKHFRDEFNYPTVGELLDGDLQEGNSSREGGYLICCHCYWTIKLCEKVLVLNISKAL